MLGFPREEVGTGAVLLQMRDSEERVIAYASKSLEGSEQHYCTARNELLPSLEALQVLPLWTEDHRKDGQQCCELATQEQRPSGPAGPVDRGDQHVRHNLSTSTRLTCSDG